MSSLKAKQLTYTVSTSINYMLTHEDSITYLFLIPTQGHKTRSRSRICSSDTFYVEINKLAWFVERLNVDVQRTLNVFQRLKRAISIKHAVLIISRQDQTLFLITHLFLSIAASSTPLNSELIQIVIMKVIIRGSATVQQ